MKRSFMMRILTVLCVGMLLSSAASAIQIEQVPFDELFYQVYPVDDWAKEEVSTARSLGLVTPLADRDFKSNISRLQFAELSAGLVEKLTGQVLTPAAEDTFTDCTEPAALKAYAAGITTGTGDGTTFSPDANITREQIAAMLVRAIAAAQRETGKTPLTGTGDLTAYTDSPAVSSWAVEGVTALNAAGIMKGTSATTLTPQGTTTIQEAVILILRIFEAAQA